MATRKYPRRSATMLAMRALPPFKPVPGMPPTGVAPNMPPGRRAASTAATPPKKK